MHKLDKFFDRMISLETFWGSLRFTLMSLFCSGLCIWLAYFLPAHGFVRPGMLDAVLFRQYVWASLWGLMALLGFWRMFKTGTQPLRQ